MLTFTLPSPVWLLPICLDSWTWHSRFLCNIALYSIGPCFSHQSHPQLGIVFALAPSLYLSRVISPLISSSNLGTYKPGEFPFQYPIILPFHTVHGVLKARILKWFAIPFSSGTYSFRPLLHLDPLILGGPTRHGLVSLSLTRLWSVWLDWLVFCDYGLCVCPLMPLAIIHLEPDILECEVKWALESITTNKASGSDGITMSYFKSWKMMLWKCCTQYASKFGKLSSGHRTRKGQFSFQSQRKAIPKNAQTTAQLHSSHTRVK